MTTEVPRFRVAIIGSRGYPYPSDVEEFVNGLPPNAVVISGGARGVDTIAAQRARARGLEVVEYLAQWDKYGRGAGYRRNHQIVDDAALVVAFWDGRSKGTAHTMGLARDQGKLLAFGIDGLLEAPEELDPR